MELPTCPLTQRVHASRHEPHLGLGQEEVDQDREDGGGDGAGEHHGEVVEGDALEDKFAQSPATVNAGPPRPEDHEDCKTTDKWMNRSPLPRDEPDYYRGP